MKEKEVEQPENMAKVEAKGPKLSRKQRRAAGRVNEQLVEILGSFYEKISQTQLTEEELREAFTKSNQKWVNICVKHKLDQKAKAMFGAQVGKTWEKKLEKAQQKSK